MVCSKKLFIKSKTSILIHYTIIIVILNNNKNELKLYLLSFSMYIIFNCVGTKYTFLIHRLYINVTNNLTLNKTNYLSLH